MIYWYIVSTAKLITEEVKPVYTATDNVPKVLVETPKESINLSIKHGISQEADGFSLIDKNRELKQDDASPNPGSILLQQGDSARYNKTAPFNDNKQREHTLLHEEDTPIYRENIPVHMHRTGIASAYLPIQHDNFLTSNTVGDNTKLTAKAFISQDYFTGKHQIEPEKAVKSLAEPESTNDTKKDNIEKLYNNFATSNSDKGLRKDIFHISPQKDLINSFSLANSGSINPVTSMFLLDNHLHKSSEARQNLDQHGTNYKTTLSLSSRPHDSHDSAVQSNLVSAIDGVFNEQSSPLTSDVTQFTLTKTSSENEDSRRKESLVSEAKNKGKILTLPLQQNSDHITHTQGIGMF